jgi:hypothetical protein
MVLGDDLEPEFVTKALGRFPNQAWRVGEWPYSRKPNGDLLRGPREAEWGCWKAFIPVHLEDESLEKQLEYWQNVLIPRASYLADLSARGWDLIITCYFATATTELIELDAATLRAFGQLGVALELHVFSDDSPTSNERGAAV